MSIIKKEICTGVLKACINTIPAAGPILIEAIFETPSRISQRRRDEYVNAFFDKVKKIPENLIDHEFIQSEEFSDLIQNLLRKAKILRAKNRVDFFLKLGVTSTLKTRSKTYDDWQVQFIEILANLNDNELVLLHDLHIHPNPAAGRLSTNTPFGLKKSDFQLCVDSLLSRGLVYDASLKGLPKHQMGSNPSPRERINISPLGKKICQFVIEIDDIFNDAFSIS